MVARVIVCVTRTCVPLLSFTGNGAVHEHAEPQPRASRRLRAHDQALLRLQGLQQGRRQQQGHKARRQAEVVLHSTCPLSPPEEARVMPWRQDF